MKKIYRFLIFIFIIFYIGGCAKTDVPTSPGQGNSNSLGNAKFNTYVAIGNSITAGYQDGAIFKEGQQHSYAKLIADQVNSLGANLDFQIPTIEEPGLGARMTLTKLDLVAGPTIAISSFTGNPLSLASNIGLTRAYNNLGVPGSVLWIPNSGGLPISDVFQDISFLTSTSRNNALFALVLRQAAFGSTIFQQAKKLNPTFITAWLGNNDVLGYATSGGTTPPSPTPAAMFQLLYKKMIDSLVSTGAQIVTATIPDVTTIPFFTTISVIHPVTHQACWGVTKSGVRQLTQGDYLTLQAKTALLQGLGALQAAPLPDAVILDNVEVGIAKQAVSDFNNAISSICSSAKLADGSSIPVVDINGVFNNIKKNGLTVAGETFTADYIEGGLFGLDGVHPSSKGQAVIANEFLKVINARFSANIPFVDLTQIPGMKLPVSSTALKQGKFNFTPNTDFSEFLKIFQP